MKNASIFIIMLCLLSAGCRSSRQVSKETERKTEQSVSRDTGSTKRTSFHEGERSTEFVDNEWEDLEFTQIHERDTTGNEKTTTNIRGHRGRDRKATGHQKENSVEQSDSTAERSLQKGSREETNREKDVTKKPAPVAGGPGAWRVYALILMVIACILVMIWPEPLRKLGRCVIKQIKTFLIG